MIRALLAVLMLVPVFGATAGCFHSHPVVGVLPEESDSDDPLLFWLAGLFALSQATSCPTEATGFAGGSGAAADPYLICAGEQLVRVAEAANLSASFRLTADVDLSQTAFAPIGSASAEFTGTLDGQYFAVRGLQLSLSGVSGTGLVGVANGATVQRLQLIDVVVLGGQNTGAVIGSMTGGTLSEVYVSGAVTSSTSQVGGVVGSARSAALLERAHSAASVTMSGGTLNAGGMVGILRSQARIVDSYFTGSVSAPLATVKVGGVVGHVFNDAGCPASSVEHVYGTGALSAPGTSPAGAIGQLQGCTAVESYCLDTVDSAPSECRQDTSGGTFSGGGQRTAAQLACPQSAGENCSGATSYVGWDGAVWNFGSAGQAPWLRWQGSAPP